MDLRDATLMFLTESAAYPAVAEVAQSARDRLAGGEDIDYRVLSQLVDEASGKGVLRAIRQKYGPVGFESIVMPVLREIGRRAPIRSSRYRYTWQPGEDPLTAGIAR
jgi:molecular chaperone DnaK (HSP70)